MSSDPNIDPNLDYDAGTASVVDMHDAVKRERVLLPAGKEQMGIVALVLCGLVLIGGGIVMGNSNGFKDTIYAYDGYVPENPPGLGDTGGAESDLPWIDQWMKGGKKVYANCKLCHQDSGLGAPGQYPPLVGSEWVDGGATRLGAILINGINGPFNVAGQSYNQLMPAWNALNDEKLAQVITYIRRTYGELPAGDDGIVTVEMVKKAREEFGGKGTWNEAGLLAIPEDAMLEGAKVDPQTGEAIQ